MYRVLGKYCLKKVAIASIRRSGIIYTWSQDIPLHPCDLTNSWSFFSVPGIVQSTGYAKCMDTLCPQEERQVLQGDCNSVSTEVRLWAPWGRTNKLKKHLRWALKDGL